MLTTTVDAAATAPPIGAAAHATDLIVRWDQVGGWASLARRGDREPEFVGFVHLGADGLAAVRDRFHAAGFAVAYDKESGLYGLLELRLTPVAAPAQPVAWPSPEVRH
ncbi:hypothetical protein [Amycolatopsis tolypomycina]|uniref:hypothetical protein n=1 Tax=Amycolatopsis tolypomycina TaxID=208445 RepID=UPI0033A230E1